MPTFGSEIAPPRRSGRFGPLIIEYDARVLPPRSWTLEQSRWAAALCAEPAAGRLLELCAGAGQIGLAAAVLADRDLVQVEADPVAAGYARRNARRAGWGHRVEVRTERLEEALGPGELFPLILADPPYLPTADTERWPEDPRTAIDGGPDGLAVTRACLVVAAAHLSRDGRLLLQVAGPHQAGRVDELAAAEFDTEEVRVIDEVRAIQLLRRRVSRRGSPPPGPCRTAAGRC